MIRLDLTEFEVTYLVGAVGVLDVIVKAEPRHFKSVIEKYPELGLKMMALSGMVKTEADEGAVKRLYSKLGLIVGAMSL